jgi:hypothetical protein
LVSTTKLTRDVTAAVASDLESSWIATFLGALLRTLSLDNNTGIYGFAQLLKSSIIILSELASLIFGD